MSYRNIRKSSLLAILLLSSTRPLDSAAQHISTIGLAFCQQPTLPSIDVASDFAVRRPILRGAIRAGQALHIAIGCLGGVRGTIQMREQQGSFTVRWVRGVMDLGTWINLSLKRLLCSSNLNICAEGAIRPPFRYSKL